MAVPGSGNSLSLAAIYAEVTGDGYGDPGEDKSSLQKLSDGTTATLNTNSSDRPDGNAPHAMSEFYSYDHSASAAFTNAQAVSKTISTGSSNAITFTDTDDTFNFVGSTAWTISFWVKAGWSNTLNTVINFIIGQKTSATYQLTDMVKIQYNESNNRIECRYGNKTTSSNAWYKNAAWLFHSNSGSYAAAYAAAGLGATYWSAANRGYVNGDDYTMITITKSTTNNASAMTLYWNANDAGAAPLQTNSGSGSPAMSSTNDRLWSLGSNGVHGASNDQAKAGNSTATVYNDVTIWNKELSSSEVSELYNEGTVMNAQTHSANSNLIGYWKFEGDGNATVSNDNFTISGSSAIVNK